MRWANTLLLVLECSGVAVALVFGALWVLNPSGPYEPITFIALFLGSTIVDFVRRHLPSHRGHNRVPQDILEQVEPSCSREKVKEVLGPPHRVISDIWLYRFRNGLVQVEFYGNGGAKTVAVALTIHSPRQGFKIPVCDKPLGQITFGDLARELGQARHRSTLRTTEILLETRLGPPGAWINYTFGALSPFAPGMLAKVVVPGESVKDFQSEAANIRINWVGLSESADEQWFEWSLAVPAMA
jgi:hypothetical protein